MSIITIIQTAVGIIIGAAVGYLVIRLIDWIVDAVQSRSDDIPEDDYENVADAMSWCVEDDRIKFCVVQSGKRILLVAKDRVIEVTDIYNKKLGADSRR